MQQIDWVNLAVFFLSLGCIMSAIRLYQIEKRINEILEKIK